MNSLLVLALLVTATVLAAPIGKNRIEVPENLVKELYKAETSIGMQRKFLEKFDDVSDEMYELILKSVRNTGLDLQAVANSVTVPVTEVEATQKVAESTVKVAGTTEQPKKAATQKAH